MDTTQNNNNITPIDINQTIYNWILSISKNLNFDPNCIHLEVQQLPGDASIRKYYLLNIKSNNQKSQHLNNIVTIPTMISSPTQTIPFEQQNSKQLIIMQTVNNKSLINFIKLAKYLINLNLPINVPQILAIKKLGSMRFVLLSYLGDQLIFKHVNLNHTDINHKHYQSNYDKHKHVTKLHNLQSNNINHNNIDQINNLNKIEFIYTLALQRLTDLQLHNLNISLQPMDRKYIKKNLNLFKNWYFKTHLNCFNKQSKHLNQLLNNLENYFVKVFEEQPQVFTHIDYHSKNLILPDNVQLDCLKTTELPSKIDLNQKLGILDFQDAMIGPITYDIASLLQDAYVIWPEELIENIISKHYDYLIAKHNKTNNIANISKAKFLKYFYLTGLQRHIKNLGIFARLKHFYKKPNYIQHIPNLLHYIYKTCNKFNDPELINLQNFLQEVSLPVSKIEL